MAMPEVFFVNVNLREGINTDQITSARRKLVSSSLFNLLGNVNDCFFICVTPCSLQHSFFLSRSVSTVFWSNLVFQLFAFCVTLSSFVCVMLYFACVTLLSVDYVTFSCVDVTRSGFFWFTEVFLLSING